MSRDLKASPPFGDFLHYYHDVDPPEWLWTAIEICSRFGVFHSDPTCCILARPVYSGYPIDQLNVFADILDPDSGLTASHDAWHVIYASGDITRFFQLATHELPKLIWQRNNEPEPRIYDYQKFKRHLHGIETKSTEATAPS